MKKTTIYASGFALLLLLTACNDNQKPETKTESDATQTSREQKMVENTKIFYESWNKIDTNLMKTVTSENFTRHANGKLEASNQSGLAAIMTYFKTAIPDLSLTPGDVVTSDNKTYTKWIVRGTNTGMFGENAPTGKSAETDGFTILTFNDEGKVTHEEGYWNPLSYLEAWGYTVTPPKTK